MYGVEKGKISSCENLRTHLSEKVLKLIIDSTRYNIGPHKPLV